MSTQWIASSFVPSPPFFPLPRKEIAAIKKKKS